MDITTFSLPFALKTHLGYKVLSQLNGDILASAPVDKIYQRENVTLAPYEDFFSFEGKKFTYCVFFYDPSYMSMLMHNLQSLSNLVFVSPSYFPIDLEWHASGTIGFPTLITYEGRFYPLRDRGLVEATAKRVEQLSQVYSNLLVVCPNANFIGVLSAEKDLSLTAFSYPLSNIENIRVLCCTNEQVYFATLDFTPDCIIDTCQEVLLFNTVMGGYYDRLVRTAEMEQDNLTVLSSLRGQGLCHRMTKIDAPKVVNYPWPEYYPSRPRPLPLGQKTVEIVNMWIEQGYPPFSALGPLCLLDNFSPLLFVYPLLQEKDASYALAVKQHYKNYFSRFAGKDSFETLANIWEIMLDEIGTFTPGYDEVSSWCSKNWLNAERMWNCIGLVQSCVNVMQKQGLVFQVGPSDPKNVSSLVRPFFSQVYSSYLMQPTSQGFELNNVIYSVDLFSLPYKEEEKKEVVGVLFDRTSESDTLIAFVDVS